MPLDSISIDPESIFRFQGNLADAIEFFDELTKEAFEEVGPEFVLRLQDDTPVGVTRRLRRLTSHRVIQDHEGVKLEIIQPAKHKGFMYRSVVVRGRMPGTQPPLEALKKWVNLKFRPANESELRRGAFRLARSMSRKGTKENKYPEDTLRRSEDLLRQVANKIGSTVTGRLMDI